MYSIAEENYIKGIFHLQQTHSNVLTNHLAAYMQTKAASATDMLQKLEAKGLLEYQKYYGAKLTIEGKRVALSVVRRHRLWEYFLVNHLKFEWDQVHEIAEQLEHIKSEILVTKLDAYMGMPKFDPHGEPIPDAKGKMKTQPQICLLNLATNLPSEICSVTDQSSELLEMLRLKKMTIGTRLEVKNRFAFDNSLEIKTKNLAHLHISQQLAKHIHVKLI